MRSYKLNILPVLILTVVSFFIAADSQAKETVVSGYIVTKYNDTIWCEFKLPAKRNGTFYVFDEVTIGTSGNEITYKAADKKINGFGFTVDSLHYNYVLKTDEDSAAFFMLRMAHGTKLNLYYHFFYQTGATGLGSFPVDVYVLEDAAKNTVTIAGKTPAVFKKKVKDLLASSPELSDLFDKKVKTINDLKSFVMAANRL